MVFLNPAILIGLLAASVPILLHFLNLRKLKKIEFSTLSFLKELQKSKIRNIKLKQWLLLVLRVLIIMFLVFAFARPTIESFNIAGSSSVKTSAVLIIDNTYSMSVIDDNGSYFNQAKKIAKDILNEFEEGDELTIITVGKPSMQFTSTKLTLIENELSDTELNPLTGSLEEALTMVSEILDESQNFNKEVYLFSDFQNNRLRKLDEKNENGISFNENTKFYFIPFAHDNLSNLTIDDLKTNNQIFEVNKPISFSAIVSNRGNKIANNSTLSLFINGQRVSQKSFSLSPAQQKELILETTINSSGLLDIAAGLEDDDITIDNSAYTSILIKDKIDLLILYDNLNDIFFLESALINSGNNINVTALNSINRNQVLLEEYDVVFIIGVNALSNDQKIIDHFNENGNLILMPGSNSNVVSFANFCNKLGITSPTHAVGAFEGKEITTSFENTALNHPVFSNLFIDQSKSVIESPEIKYYLKFPSQLRERKIISLIDGSPFLFEKITNKTLVFNISPNLLWSDFPIKGIFAPLLNKCVSYVSSDKTDVNNYIAGIPIDLKVADLKSSLIKLEKPNGQNEFINIDSLGNKNYYQYVDTKQTGVYKFYNNDELIDFAVVNIDPEESNIEISEKYEVEEFLKELNYDNNILWIEPDDDFKTVIYQSRFGSELWKYFLIIALLLALVEMFIARSAKKDMVEFTK